MFRHQHHRRDRMYAHEGAVVKKFFGEYRYRFGVAVELDRRVQHSVVLQGKNAVGNDRVRPAELSQLPVREEVPQVQVRGVFKTPFDGDADVGDAQVMVEILRYLSGLDYLPTQTTQVLASFFTQRVEVIGTDPCLDGFQVVFA